MATSPGKWEVVGKGGKAHKKDHGTKKNKAKINEADMPKLDIKEPIPETKTQFDAFTEEPAPQPPKEQPSKEHSDNEELSTELVKKHEKRRRHHQKEPQLSLQDIVTEAMKKCDFPTVKAFISDTKQKYDNQLVMLKELTKFLQEPFEPMPVEKDPVLGKQLREFPLSCMEDEVQDLIFDELRECDENEIDKLFVHCLDELLIEINKGRATYGIRTMIQYLVKCSPLVAFRNKEEYLERVVKRKNNSREALSLLWAYGQTSEYDDFVERLRVWSTFLLPFIENKQLSKHVVEYLEVTFSYEPPQTLSDSLLDGNDFQCITEIAFATSYQQFPYRRQLQLLYPEIKAIVFAAYPNTPLTDIFCHLFDSLSNDYGSEYVREVLHCLLECLEKDPTCHYKWRNNYLGRLKESSLLLNALVEQWESVCRSVPRKYLSETLNEFHAANKELKLRERHKAGLSECETSCNTLLGVMATSSPPIEQPQPSRLYRVFKFLFWILLVVVCIDLYKHSGYDGSKTSGILKDYGVEEALNTTYQHSKLYVQRLESWTEKRYPYYYKKVQEVVEPASEYTITKLHEVLNYLLEITAPARAYLHENVPPLLEKCENFVVFYVNCISEFVLRLWDAYSPVLIHYLQLAWDTLAVYVPLAWVRAREITWNALQWLYRLSPEFFDAIADGFRRLVTEVVTTTPHVLALVQEYLLTAWKLLVSTFTAMVTWLQTNLGFAAANKNTVS